MKQFETSVFTIMQYLKKEEFSPSVISTHRLCYKELHTFLARSGRNYSPEVACQWLAEHKSTWNYSKYINYRHCIDQLEDVRRTGAISLEHLSARKPAYSQLCPAFRSVLDSFIRDHPENDDRHRIAGARFLLYLQGKGLDSVTGIDYDILLQFHADDHHISLKSKNVYEDLIRNFLRYLSAKGICTPGLPLALNKLLIHQIIRIPDKGVCKCSGKTYPHFTCSTIDEFLNGLKEARYGKTVLNSSRHILSLLYIFLDMHHAELSDGLLWYWFGRVKPLLGSGWKQHRRSLCQFLYFLDTRSILTSYTGDPQTIRPEEVLSPWLRVPLSGYLQLLKREGWQPSTISMHRLSNLRFCRYLQYVGLNSFTELTPSILKDFNLQDRHSTPEGKAAYNCRIRSFIIFLYEQGLAEDPYLYRALPTVTSQRISVVRILSEEETAAIWAVDPDTLSPTALRDYAMVCLGLSMGFRASDITGLCFKDIDWKQRSIRIIQQKTGKLLAMPMPVKTGNILFRYLCNGRPRSDEPFLFISHRAPYGRLQNNILLDGELTETQTANYFSNFYRIDCTVPPVNARFCRKPGAVLPTRGVL